MSAWLYRKPEATHIRGLCILCAKCQQKRTSDGTYQALCNTCDQRRYKIKKKDGRNKYRKHKLEVCNRCNFIPVAKCQLDVHHMDGNHKNNDPNNLETLCANCHRLEHKKTPGGITRRGFFSL